MAWQNPKTDWKAGDVPAAPDFNRIEGNVQELQNTKETPAGAQAKANTAEANAKAYTDAHEQKTAPHSGHETPAGAQAKAEAAAGVVQAELNTHKADDVSQTNGVHGIRVNETLGHIEYYDGEWKVPSPPPDDTSGSPGSANLIAGTMQAGFFGEVSASELISGDALANLVGISQGTSQNSTAGWLKFAWKGKILFVAKKAFRNSISWDHINSANAVYGDKSVVIDGLSYKIRLLKGALTDPSEYQNADRGAHGSEWNRLMLPIHQEAIDKSWAYPAYVEGDIPVWAHGLGTGTQNRYADEDLLTKSDYGSGSYSWCQETRKDNTAHRVFRGGYGGVSYSSSNTFSYTSSSNGWRPCLEFSV